MSNPLLLEAVNWETAGMDNVLTIDAFKAAIEQARRLQEEYYLVSENEYILTQHLTNIRAAESVLRDLLTGEEYHTSEDDYQEVMALLQKMRRRLERAVEMTMSEGGE